MHRFIIVHRETAINLLSDKELDTLVKLVEKVRRSTSTNFKHYRVVLEPDTSTRRSLNGALQMVAGVLVVVLGADAANIPAVAFGTCTIGVGLWNVSNLMGVHHD